MAGSKKYVRRGHLSATLTQFESGLHEGSWRINYKDRNGKWQTGGIYKKFAKAEELAEEILEKIDKGDQVELSLTNEEVDIVELLRKRRLGIHEIKEWINSRQTCSNEPVYAVVDEYLEKHVPRQSYSSAHDNDVRRTLRLLKEAHGEIIMTLINVNDLETLLINTGVSPKRQNNMRAILSTFWKWAKFRNHCEDNIAEKVPILRIKKTAGGHEVLLPHEFALMLNGCPELFFPWLVISGFAGLRGSEIYGRPKERHLALKWEDFHFHRKKPVIVVRPETSKTNTGRHVPICPALADWLEPWKNKKGLVHPHVRPSSASTPATETLGKLIGGWRNNCLRASRASYRLAQTLDPTLTAREGGHSETMLESTYNNPRFEEDAELWFSLDRAGVKKLLTEEKVVKIG